MAASLALPLLISQHRRKGRGVCVALSLILFLQKAGICAGDTTGECRVEVLKGNNSVLVPFKDGNAVLLWSPKYTEPLLQNIKFLLGETEFTCQNITQRNDSWWQQVVLTDDDDNKDYTNDSNHVGSAETSTEQDIVTEFCHVGKCQDVTELMIRNNGEDTRLVAVNCDENACPIINSTSMNAIRKRRLPDNLVYARKTTLNAAAVLTNYSNCTVSRNSTLYVSCINCGITDIWKSEAEGCSWVKLTKEDNTSSHMGQTMNMVQVVFSSGMEWALGCEPDKTDSTERTTIQDSLPPTTPLSPTQYHVPARTQNTNEGSVITDANNACLAYVWMTLIALLNTLLLLVLLSLIAHHMISQEQMEMDEEEKATGKTTKLKKIMDGVVAFWHSYHPSQAATSSESHHSHPSIHLPENEEDNSQKHAQLPLKLEPNISTERHTRLSIPAHPLPPLSPPPCPATDELNYQNPLDSQDEEPEYDYIDLPIMPVPPQQQQLPKDNQESLKKVEGSNLNQTQPCPYSESKSTTERQKGSLMQMPPPPSLTLPPCPGIEKLNSEESSDTTEEEHEYDYIAMPVMPLPSQQQQ